jgi:hypothetical protein
MVFTRTLSLLDDPASLANRMDTQSRLSSGEAPRLRSRNCGGSRLFSVGLYSTTLSLPLTLSTRHPQAVVRLPRHSLERWGCAPFWTGLFPNRWNHHAFCIPPFSSKLLFPQVSVPGNASLGWKCQGWTTHFRLLSLAHKSGGP